jgi:hypothetical protein
MGDEPTSIQIQCNQRNKYQNIIIPNSRFEMLNPIYWFFNLALLILICDEKQKY